MHQAQQQVGIGAIPLVGDLELPKAAKALIVFVHGSGSSRHSPRNRLVADALHLHHLGTLLFDLLREDEADDRRKVFDIGLLTRRVRSALDWVDERPELEGLPIGLFGASTGSAAALCAAADRPTRVGALVSRGGRPDLACDCLPRTLAPTLLIVGGRDREVLAMNRAALALIAGLKRLEVVPGATHLFEEPGALDTVAHLAADWFDTHLADRRRT